MDAEENAQVKSEATEENRGIESGSNTATKYVNGEVDNMPKQHIFTTTLAPLEAALDTATKEDGKGKGNKKEEKDPSTKQKRDSHNEIERRRKCKINIGIIKLGEIIPSCINAKLSKNQILEHAANHILDLTAKCEKLLTSSASETQAEEIKLLMKENEKLRQENKRFQELMKTLQIPPNSVANPTAYLKGKGKKNEKLMAITKNVNSGTMKPVVATNTARVVTTTPNMTIMPSTNQIAGVNQVGTNQQVVQPGVGNAMLVQNPNGGYFLVPTNNKTTISVPNNQGQPTIAPNSVTVVSTASSQVVNSSDGSNQVTIGQATVTTISVGTTTATTQSVSTPIASATPQGAVVQAPGGVQTIRYLTPMNQNQTTTQTVMVMAKPNNQNMPIRIAPQQPIRIAAAPSTQPQVILPQPSGVQSSTNPGSDKSDSKKKSSPPKIKNLTSTDGDKNMSTSGTSGVTTTPVTVAPNQVVLQRPPIQTTSVAQGGVNQNVVTMQVVPPKPVSQQLVYIQQNGQLIPVVIQNPNAQNATTVIQQPQQQQQGAPNQNVITIPINQNQGVLNNQRVVVISQASGATGVITNTNNSATTTGMVPLSVVTSQSGSATASGSNNDDILAKAAESIFSPNMLNDNSPMLNFNEATETGPTTSAPAPKKSSNSLAASLPPFPILIEKADDPVVKYLQSVGQQDAASSPSDSHGKKQKKSKKKKKKKEKSKDKDKEKSKVKKEKGKEKKKSKQKGGGKSKAASKAEDEPVVKTEDDNTMIKELDRGIANSIDALPDSTSGAAIITDTLLQEWIEKEAGLTSPDQDDENSRGDAITNVTANQDESKKEEVEPMDAEPVENSSSAPSNFSAEALLSNDTPQTNASPSVPATTTVPSTTTTTTSSGESTSTASGATQNPFSNSFPSFSFGSDILSSSMSVSGLPTYIEDEESSDAKLSGNASKASPTKPQGSVRDSILSFGGSQTQTNTTQAATSHTQSDQSSNNQQNNQSSKDQENKDDTNDHDSSRSPSPASSLPIDSSPPCAPAPPPRNMLSPESNHEFSPSPERPNLFGSGSNFLSETLDATKEPPQEPEEESDDVPQYEPPPSPFPASHNSSWISHHSRASHLASASLKKQKPPPTPTSLPLAVSSTSSSSTTTVTTTATTSSGDNPLNIPPGFYTLPWLGPPITTSSTSSSRMTPTTQGPSNQDSSLSEKPSIPKPTYLPTEESSPPPSYAPNRHSSSSTSYAPAQRSSSPTYVPPPHRKSPPSYFSKVPQSLSISSSLTVDTSVAHPIFSSSSLMNTPPSGRSVITTAHQPTSVTTTKSSAKLKSRPMLSKTKFSPSTIHRTLTSGITEEESPEKAEEPPEPEQRSQKEQQQREWQHKMPMQIKPGPDIRSKDGLLAGNNSAAPPAPLVKTKHKKSKKKKAAAMAAAAAAAAALSKDAELEKSNLDDIGKRELPKNLVDQFPWLDEEENEKKGNKNQGQSDRLTSFSIKSITQQTAMKGSEPLSSLQKKSKTTPSQKSIATPSSSVSESRSAPTSTTNSQSRINTSYSQNQGSTSTTSFWNPSTTGQYPRSTESSTLMTQSNRPSPAVSGSSVSPGSKSRIEYMPRQSPSSFNPNPASSTTTNMPPSHHHQQSSPVSSLPNFGGAGSEKQMPSPLGYTPPPSASSSSSQASDNHPSQSSGRSRKQALYRKQSSYNQKQSAPQSEPTTASPLSSPPESSNSPLFSADFPLGGITPNLMPNSAGVESRTAPSAMNQKQDSMSPRMQMSSQSSPLIQPASSRSSALPTPPSDNFLFSPTGSSGSAANQSSEFSNPGTNRSDNNQSDGDDFMMLAQAEKSLDFLPSSSPDQSQNVDSIDLTSLPMFDTPASTLASTPSSMPGQPTQRQQQQQQHMGSRTSVDRQSQYGQSQGSMRGNQQSHPMYPLPNASSQRQVAVTSPHSMTSHTASQNRFMPSPEMQHHANQGTKRPASDSNHPQPSAKRTAAMQHHNQMSMPLMQGHEATRGVVLERAPAAQTSHIHRVDHGIHRGQTPPTTVSQQVGSPHSALQHNPRSVERQPSSGPEMPRAPTYDLSQRVGAQRSRPSDMVPSSRHEAPRVPMYDLSQSVPQRTRSTERQSEPPQRPLTYDLSQSVPSQRNRSVEQQAVSEAQQRTPAYDLSQSVPQRTRSTERQSEPLQRPPTYDLSQSVPSQRNRSVEQQAVAETQQRNPAYELSQSVSQRNRSVERQTVSETQQRTPAYDLSQSVPQRNRSVERQTVSETQQRTPAYDLSQSVPQRNRSVERQAVSETQQRTPAYDLSQSVPQRNRSIERQTVSESQQRTPTYDLSQSIASQRNPSVERQAEAQQRTPTYDLSQSAGAQRSRSMDNRPPVSEPRIPTYDLTQSAGTQRNRSVKRQPSASEVHRTPVYDLTQSAGRNSVERHQQSRSETQRVPTYDLSQSAGTQRTRSTERPTSASESQRIPTYDLTQSPHREPVQPPKQQRKRQQNNTEQYFPTSDNTSSLRHMDSSISQETNPWPGFPSQRMSSSVPSTEPSLLSPPFLPNFSSQSLPSSMSQSEPTNTSSSASIVPSISPSSRRIRSDMPTYLPTHPLAPILSSPPQASKSSIGREAEISTPFNPMFQAHTRAGLGMNVTPNFPSVFHEHPHQHAPPPFNVAKAQLPGGVGVHPSFNLNFFNEVAGPNTSHSDTPGLPVHTMHHLHGNPGMSVEDSMAHMRSNVPGRHVHGHQAFGNNMRIDSLLGQNVAADGRPFKVGVSPMGAPFHSFGPGMPF